MYQILDHIQVTRKKQVCHVLNENGGLMWTGKSAGHAIAWLHENDHDEASIKVGENEYQLKFCPFPF